MRTSLLALALVVAAPAFAATSVHSADGMFPVVAIDAAPSSVAQPAVRVIINTPTVLSASLELQTAEGHLVRSYEDRLLWVGESVVELNVDDIPAGTYYLVIKTALGSQTHTIVVA